MSNRLLKAFEFTTEEQADAFERYANAFLVDDYPEMKPLGGKKDKGMDAYVYENDTGKTVVVVQSCVSPAETARTKVMGTIKKLKENKLLPDLLVYCTSANIGTELDVTKKEIRRDYRITLDVCDAAWFVTRHQTSLSRSRISESYARETLEPIVRSLQPDKLYSLVLSNDQQRVAFQYLEGVNLDRSKDSNLTKGIFDSLIACVLRDSDPQGKAYTEAEIVSIILGMFPTGHAARIKEIVPGRIRHLAQKKAIHLNKPAGGYVLSFPYKDKVQGNIKLAQDRELAFLAALGGSVKSAATSLKVNYVFAVDKVVEIGHQILLWYLNEQGKVVSDPTAALLNILNAEKLVAEFLKKRPLPKPTAKAPLTEEQVMDLLPRALFAVLSTKDEEVRKYLRGKADLFIVHGFLQATPDVQEACKKLLANDVLYLDTSILIRCIAEHYSTGTRKPLLETLEGARQLGYQLRTWRSYIGELVFHLRYRVEQEWFNHYRSRSADELAVILPTARTLVRVFCERAKADGRSVPGIVEEIMGESNQQANTEEFIGELFCITTEDLPKFDDRDQDLRINAEIAWRKARTRRETMQEEQFSILVKNDVDCYAAILRLRRVKPEGPDYGHKIWYLSTDQTVWRISKMLSGDSSFEVGMSFNYLINCVATLAITGTAKIPDELIPATSILEEAEAIPAEIRAAYEKVIDLGEAPFLRNRRLRDMAHKAKAAGWQEVDALAAQVDQAAPITEDDL